MILIALYEVIFCYYEKLSYVWRYIKLYFSFIVDVMFANIL